MQALIDAGVERVTMHGLVGFNAGKVYSSVSTVASRRSS